LAVARLIGWLAKAIAWFETLKNKIVSVFSGAGQWLYNAGKDIVNGLKNGITNAIGGAVEAVKSVAGKVTGAFKSALGIRSPSTVFESFGKDITAGLIKGVSSGQSLVNSAVDGLTVATTPTITSSDKEKTTDKSTNV